jgi:hypothetical protein
MDGAIKHGLAFMGEFSRHRRRGSTAISGVALIVGYFMPRCTRNCS